MPAEYTPTKQDLRDIAEFFHARSLQEAGAAGMLQHCRDYGVTVGVRTTTKGLGADLSDNRRKELKQKTETWLEQHSPERFVDMTNELYHLAYELAHSEFGSDSYALRAAWRTLTRTASRMWGDHPDFNPSWAQLEEADVQA
jgi:hypothetical protein